MSRFCESCGSPIEEDSAFCEVCGAKVEPDEETGADAVEPVDAPPVQPVSLGVAEAVPEVPAGPITETPAIAPPVQEPEPVTAPDEVSEPVYAAIPEVIEEPATPQVEPRPALSEPNPIMATSEKAITQSHSSMPKLAIAAVAVLVVAGGIFGGMQLLKGKPSSEPAKPESKPSAIQATPAAPAETPSQTKATDLSELRTEVTKVLGDVSAAGWSDAVCDKSLPKLKSLIAKAKEGGREDLGTYWTSLSSYIQACNAASKKDRASSKKLLTSAVSELSKIPVEEIVKDPVLKGDVIGTIGSYMLIANDMGLPSSYPSCQILVQLKNKLEKQ
jgi:hypothetical protein